MESKALLIGDPAPAIRVSEFLKGKPFETFAPGQVYVVEFWATWCGPCISNIPHLSALQHKHTDFIVLGVAVCEADLEVVKTFVRTRDAEIGYRIATDAPSDEDGSTRRGWMYQNWCAAAYQSGIPHVFLVDGSGHLAWIGYPEKLDEPLAAVLAGTWDLPAAALAHREKLAAAKTPERFKMVGGMRRLLDAGNRIGALELLGEVFAQHPDIEMKDGGLKLRVLFEEDYAAALAYARHLINLAGAQDATLMYEIGEGLWRRQRMTSEGEEQGPCPEVLTLSLEAFTKSEPLTDGEYAQMIRLDALEGRARVLLALGRTEEALARAESALEVAVAYDGNSSFKARITETLTALIQNCRQAARATVPQKDPHVVCDGDLCRIVA